MSENPARHLSAAAEAVRAFNHQSRSVGDGWYFPSDSYTALGSLSHLVSMLGQAISQATRPVMNTHEQVRVLIDGGGNPDAAVAELQDAREAAFDAAARLTAAVQRMHNITSPMGYDTRGLPEFQDAPDRTGPVVFEVEDSGADSTGWDPDRLEFEDETQETPR